MSRDVRRRQSEPPENERRRGGSTLGGLFMGLVLGICIAAGVAWYTSRGATPFVNKAVVRDKPATAVSATPAPAETGATPAPVAPAPVAAAAVAPTPVTLAGKPGDAVPTERRFQFYDILQGKSDPVPSKEGQQAKSEASAADLKPSVQAVYLQAGAFSKMSDAENQKATLAMQGVESVIQQVMAQDKTLYRVRLGPYARPEDANKVKQELGKSGIEVNTVKQEK